MITYTLDTGALIALERRDPLMLALLRDVTAGRAAVAIPRTVVAQIWRGTPRQATVHRLIKAARALPTVVVDELTEERAKQIGITIGQASHPDIVDVHVAVTADERGQTVITSDPSDIAKVDPDLVVVPI